jgi:tRNA modification GTPase
MRGIDARLAHAGEFTARAFFNGRLDLTQAEGVAATIAARSDAELRAASLLRTGAFGSLATAWADRLANVLALVEAGIDFTDEEDVIAITPLALHERLRTLASEIATALQRAVGMERLEAIPWVVLRGAPNAGKSTLFNALLGHERAVVSEIAGTTRDVIAEPLHITLPSGDAEVMLVDLAGLDEVDASPMNQFMQRAARDAANRAELILHCVPITEEACCNRIAHDSILVRTKCDLLKGDVQPDDSGGTVVHVSSRDAAGLDALRRTIAVRLSSRAVSLASDALALAPRHEQALRTCAAHLDDALSLVAPQREQRALRDAELAAAAMRAALDDLAALAGNITPDDVLGRIFASFCIGK